MGGFNDDAVLLVPSIPSSKETWYSLFQYPEAHTKNMVTDVFPSPPK
jgi:hypothetical protein